MISLKEAISAGGVIVRNRSNICEVLLMRDSRYTDWTLPKGHVEEGETLEEAAIREVSEEAGIKDVLIIMELGSFRRFVNKANEWKTIHYFLMQLSDTTSFEKTENPFVEINWHSIDALPPMFLSEQEEVITSNITNIKKTLV